MLVIITSKPLNHHNVSGFSLLLLFYFYKGIFVIKTQQLNIDLLDSYLETLGTDILLEMLELYIQQSATYLDNIDSARQQQSQQLWQDHCHKMKGATASVGLLGVHTKLVSIEKLNGMWLEKIDHVKELIGLNNQGISAFKIWLATK